MKLVYEKTGKEVKVGDQTATFRGEEVTVTGMREPHKEGSTGRVYVKDKEGREAEYYPSVIDAKWVKE